MRTTNASKKKHTQLQLQLRLQVRITSHFRSTHNLQNILHKPYLRHQKDFLQLVWGHLTSLPTSPPLYSRLNHELLTAHLTSQLLSHLILPPIRQIPILYKSYLRDGVDVGGAKKAYLTAEEYMDTASNDYPTLILFDFLIR